MDNTYYEYADYEYEYNPDAEYDEDNYDSAYYDEEEYDYANNDDGNYPQFIPELWKKVRLKQGNEFFIVNVSNRGRVKPEGTFQEAIASDGIHQRGTPYMITYIGTRAYYIHELVWLAFIGPIMPGYEVRHKSLYVHKRPHKTYCNRAECLEIYPKNVCHITIDDSLNLCN